MSRLATALNTIAAHVCIETGTHDGWTYRKYADGHVEAWKDISIAATAGTQWGSLNYYYQDVDVDLPSGWIRTTSNASVQATSGNTQWWIFGAWFQSTTSIRARLCKFASSSQAAVIRISIKG